MLRIGITGGIGSGKTTVAGIFEVLGVPVYYADTAAKRLMQEDENLKKEIIAHFGEKVYEKGVLNRAYLSALVFTKSEKLEQLNALVHPATIRDAENWMAHQYTSYVIKEAALLFESGSQAGLDYIIGTAAPLHLRVERTMKRDLCTKEEVMARMDKQIQESVKMRLCHFVIHNNEREAVVPQVLALHQTLLELSKAKTTNG